MNDHTPFSAIVTSRLLLRRFRPSDAESFFCYRTLPEVARYQSEGWLSFTAEDAAAFVARQASAGPFVPGVRFQIAIERLDTGELIGDIGLFTPAGPGEAELGFTIAPAHQKQGFAYEAIRHLFDYLFGECRLSRIVSVADLRNAPSVRLMLKLGMRPFETANGEVRFAISGDAWR